MVRKVVKEGDTMQLLSNSSSESPRETFIRVVRVHSPWEEENEPMGTEVAIELSCNGENENEVSANNTMSQLVARFGDIPIPPYLNRESATSDRTGFCIAPTCPDNSLVACYQCLIRSKIA